MCDMMTRFAQLAIFLLFHILISSEASRKKIRYCGTNTMNPNRKGECQCADRKKYGFITNKYSYVWKESGGVHSLHWYNCNPTATGNNEVNLPWAVENCDNVFENIEWGNSFSTENEVGSKVTSPIGVRYAMRCEIQGNRYSLCPKDYSTETKDPKWCYRYQMIMSRPYNSKCYEHKECDTNLYCQLPRSSDGGSSDGPGKCEPCAQGMYCPPKTESYLNNWPTCTYGENMCPYPCLEREGSSCDDEHPCCRRLKCHEGFCTTDECIKDGPCTSATNICAGYGCKDGTVLHSIGQPCKKHADCLSGTQCYHEYDTDDDVFGQCKKITPEEEKRVIYQPIRWSCRAHVHCDVNLYCHIPDTMNYGTCWPCSKGDCPEKGEAWNPCSYGANGCPTEDDTCQQENQSCVNYRCCRDTECDSTSRACSPCQKEGNCTNDDGLCSNYACDGGTVVFSLGQTCHLDADCLLDTYCHPKVHTCQPRKKAV